MASQDDSGDTQMTSLDSSDHDHGASGVHSLVLRLRHLLVEADHLSSVNKYLPWRYPLGSLVMAAVAAALCGLYLHVHAYVLLIGIGAVIALGMVWPKVSLLGVRGDLSFGARQAVEGTSAPIHLVVTNWLPVGAWGLRLSMSGARTDQGGPAADTVMSLAVAPALRRTEFEFEFVPEARGVYPDGPAYLGCGFPFGLWEARRRIEVSGQLIVWPRSYPLGPLPEAAASDRSREGLVSMNKAGLSGDFYGVRPYRRGDSLRRIHWGQTARHGELIICERQASACTHLQIVLALDPAEQAGRGSSGSREWAIRIGASLVECFLNQGSLVEMVIDEQVIAPGTGRAHRACLLDALARISAEEGLPLSAVLAQTVCRKFRHGLQAVITTDRGLHDVPEGLLRNHASHLIVLRTSAFETPASGGVRPLGRRVPGSRSTTPATSPTFSSSAGGRFSVPTEPKVNRHLVRLTFILTGVGTLASEVALAGPGKSLVGVVAVALTLTAWSAAVFALLGRRAKREAAPSLTTIAAAAALLGALWLFDLSRAVFALDGLPYELWLVLLLRDVGLCLAGACGIPVCLRITGGVSVALVLFSACLAEHKVIFVILAIYAVVGSYWLILLYWSLLHQKLLEGRSHRLPVVSVTVVAVIVCGVTVLAVGPRRTAGSLAELFGSSGGTQKTDLSARAGVGDGDNLARAQHAPQSTGPVDSDIFLESTERSLYDASNDRWGEPRKNREQILAKAVANQSNADLHEQSEQSRPTREFSLVRRPPQERPPPPRRLADAALYVTGKTPLHLRFLAYDRFDGANWLEPTFGNEDSGLVRGLGGWLYPPESTRAALRGLGFAQDHGRHTGCDATGPPARIRWASAWATSICPISSHGARRASCV